MTIKHQYLHFRNPTPWTPFNWQLRTCPFGASTLATVQCLTKPHCVCHLLTRERQRVTQGHAAHSSHRVLEALALHWPRRLRSSTARKTLAHLPWDEPHSLQTTVWWCPLHFFSLQDKQCLSGPDSLSPVCWPKASEGRSVSLSFQGTSRKKPSWMVATCTPQGSGRFSPALPVLQVGLRLLTRRQELKVQARALAGKCCHDVPHAWFCAGAAGVSGEDALLWARPSRRHSR